MGILVTVGLLMVRSSQDYIVTALLVMGILVIVGLIMVMLVTDKLEQLNRLGLYWKWLD